MTNMIKRHSLRALYAVLVITLLGIIGCSSGPSTIEKGLLPSEYFKKAQSAVIEWGDYNRALALYQAVLDQYPNDRVNGVVARYEIAFIHYKQKEYETALTGMKEIIGLYSEEGAQGLPPWPPVLAEQIINKIEDRNISTRK